jgi:SAM-dependent methyltransferase
MIVTADCRFYDNTASISEHSMADMARGITSYYNVYKARLENHFKGRSEIDVLELGAGTCCLSLLLSNLPFVRHIRVLDISMERMRKTLPVARLFIAGSPEKIVDLKIGDFSRALDFADGSFDLIAFDGALHHSRSIWTTLAECRRLLRPGGLLVAQREQYLGVLTYSIKLNSLLKTPEVQNGVSENAYLRKQYEYYLRAGGFKPEFIPVAENWGQRLLLPLNGLLQSKWVILAKASE